MKIAQNAIFNLVEAVRSAHLLSLTQRELETLNRVVAELKNRSTLKRGGRDG